MNVLYHADAIVLRAWTLEAPRHWWRSFVYDVKGQWASLTPTDQQALLAYGALLLTAIVEQVLQILGKLLVARAGPR